MSVFLIWATLAAAGTVATPPTDAEVRAAVQRSIPFIETQGVWWIEQKKCVTCHRTGNMVWSLGAARRRGLPVSEQLDSWLDWSLENSLVVSEQGKVSGAGNLEGVAQLILARQLFARQAARDEAQRRLLELVIEGQEADGSWKAGGQLPSQKRAASETVEVSTMWLTLALAQADEASHPGRPAALEKSLARIAASSPGQSTEWFATRLLLAQQLGDTSTAASLIDSLRTHQQADGGWGWLLNDPSDALGTGLALYALIRAGVARDDAAVQRAQRFLLATQREDGSWAVKGTKANKKERIEETAVYWGATWAALALIESLPE